MSPTGLAKFKRQVSVLSFLRKLLIIGNSGRELDLDEIEIIDKMRDT